MAETKHTTIRLDPKIRELANMVCEVDHRTLTNLIEVALLEYAKARGVTVGTKK